MRGDSVWSLMAGSTVFVLVSNYEGEPNTVLEAVAFSCRLILSDISHHSSPGRIAQAIYVDSSSEKQVAEARRTACHNSCKNGTMSGYMGRLGQEIMPLESSARHIDFFNNSCRDFLRSTF